MTHKDIFLFLSLSMVVFSGCGSSDPVEIRKLATEEYQAQQKAANEEYKKKLDTAEAERRIRLKAAEKVYKDKLRELNE